MEKLLQIFVALSFLFTSSLPASAVTIRNDNGGLMVEYAERAHRWKKEGRKVVIAGRCYSACTLYLSIPTACVKKGTQLGFHLAYGPDPSAVKYANKYMLQVYPPKVRAWVKKNGGLTKKLLILKGKELQRTVKMC